ncbi:MAG: hypothetical protein GXO24_03345 [Chlorobi bacterium]|nr:hypothetical protein [Chlorobiota bacterium]
MRLFSKLKSFFGGGVPKTAVGEGSSNESDIFGTDEIIYTVEVKDVNSILTVCQKDFSKPGMEAARRVPDMQFANQVLKAIKGKLLNYVQKVENIFDKRLRDLEEKLKHYEKENLHDMAMGIRSEMDKLQEEKELLEKLKTEIREEEENGAFMHIRESFMTGFRQEYVAYHRMQNIGRQL